MEAQKQGYDAMAITHFQDAGLAEVKSVADIPVLGLGETTSDPTRAAAAADFAGHLTGLVNALRANGAEIALATPHANALVVTLDDYAAAVRAVRGHCVVCIGHLHDASMERSFLALQTVWITSAIPVFVV